MEVICQILLNRPRDGTYKAGGIVSGSMKYCVDKPMELKNIIISLVGRGVCKFKCGETDYEGNEAFVVDKLSILDKNGRNTSVLDIGAYQTNFQFNIPIDIPPTFKNPNCEIVYRVCIKFQTRIFGSKKFVAPIPVASYAQPLFEGSMFFGLNKSFIKPFSNKEHTIKLLAKIPNTVLKSGENVDINYLLTNDSAHVISSVMTELVCYTTYTADDGTAITKDEYWKESTFKTIKVPVNAIANLTSTIPIPANLQTIHCKIIKKEYKLKVTIKLPMPYKNAAV